MSLFSTIQMANNSINAAKIGLQVVGQNIANANTPGYIREQVILKPSETQREGALLLGTGVRVEAIVQKIDKFLEERLRNSASDRAGAETQEQTFSQLEQLIGELSETDLSTSLTNFFNSISEVLNQPESPAIRNLAVLQAQTLAGDVNRLSRRVVKLRDDTNEQIVGMAEDINRLVTEIRQLNVRIAEAEGGNNSASDAVGLLDQRNVALADLAELVDIRVEEAPNGSVGVFAGGEFLVFEGQSREVFAAKTSEGGLPTAQIQFQRTKAPLDVSGGKLAGLIDSRDSILDGYLEGLDDLAGTLAFEFNKVFASGQGLTGYQQITSEFAIDDSTLPLDEAGLPFTPGNGAFDVLARNAQTGLTRTTTVRVDLNGLDEDATLDDLVAAIDQIDGLSAGITPTGRLSIESDSPNVEFAFARDTSGVLAALGINTLFTGTTASDLGVSQVQIDDPSKFAASANGIGEDTQNAELLAVLLDAPLQSQGDASLSEIYDRLTNGVTQGSAVATNIAEGFRTFEQQLSGQRLAISGVNIDEEAIRMLEFQTMFRASARLISTLADLLDTLVNL